MLQTVARLFGVGPETSAIGRDAALTISEDGWLDGPGVTRIPSVRHSPLSSREPDGDAAPLGITWHWSGGSCRPGYAELLAKKIRTLKPSDRRASWHIIISKQGAAYQSVSCERGSWHCATGTVTDAGGKRHRVNRSLVGVELENAGRLKRVEGSWYCHPYWKQDKSGADLRVAGERVPDPKLLVESERVAVVKGKGAFDSFSEAQIVAASRVLALLVDRYALDLEHCGYLHGDFDARKEDAGPLWRQHLNALPIHDAPL